MVVVRPGGQFEVIRRLAPGAVCHCRGHDFLDIACRGCRFVIANLHADEPSQVRSASPAVGALQQVTRTVPSISGKRLSGSKRLRRVSREFAVLRDAASPAGIGQFAAIQSAAPSFGVELIPLTVHDGVEIERGVSSNGALIVTARWSMFLFKGAAITSDYFTPAIARPLTWVRCMIRREFGLNASRRCLVQRLSHGTRSPTRRTCPQANWA